MLPSQGLDLHQHKFCKKACRGFIYLMGSNQGETETPIPLKTLPFFQVYISVDPRGNRAAPQSFNPLVSINFFFFKLFLYVCAGHRTHRCVQEEYSFLTHVIQAGSFIGVLQNVLGAQSNAPQILPLLISAFFPVVCDWQSVGRCFQWHCLTSRGTQGLSESAGQQRDTLQHLFVRRNIM